ncbi:MAG: DUF309 domain-containing protein [Bacilli bacterium]
MPHTVKFNEYLTLFHRERDYFECHEVLEEHWKALGEPKNSVWVLFISIAVGSYHWRRVNFKGAEKSFLFATELQAAHEEGTLRLGVDPLALKDLLHSKLCAVQQNERYVPFDLPLTDQSRYTELRLGEPLRYTEEQFHFIKEKHRLRDRTDVLEERQAAISKRQK